MSDTPFEIGEAVVDRDRTDPKPAIVVNRPPQTVDEWIAYTNTTVAEDNPNYPTDAPVIVVVYRHDLEEFDSDWANHDGQFSLTELNEAGVSHYSFPAPRLERLTTDDESEAADADKLGSESENERADERTDNAGTDKNERNSAIEGDSSTEAEAEINVDSGPSAAVRALEQRLSEGGMTTALEADNRTIRATKLGETYRLRPGDVIEGDGALRSRLEEIVGADQHTTD